MSSHTSSPSPSSPSSIYSDEEEITRTMGDVIKDYDTEELIDYLDRQDLKLIDADFKILRDERVAGSDFLELTKDDFHKYGFKGGPASRLAKFVDKLNETKLQAFSSYKKVEQLKELLKKYKVNGEEITDIKQFNPVIEKIDDDDEALKHCIDDIILILTNIETMTDANEATRCEFISSILHASLAIARRHTKEEKLYISLQKDISGEDATGRVDYSIKGKEDLMCIAEGKPRNVKIGYLQNIKQLESAYHTNKRKRTADQAFCDNDYDYLYGIVSTATEWHFIIFSTDGLYCTSENEYQINLSKTAVKENIDILRNSVQRIIGIIVGLLKDRITASKEPESKRRRVQEKIKH